MSLDEETCDKLLDRLIQRIPESSGCPDGCCRCCGPVAMTKTEARRLKLPRMFTRGKGEHGDTCEFVDDDTGKCQVYADRPFVCRFFNSPFAGVFKCFEIPGHGGITPKEAWSILEAYYEFVELEGQLDEYAHAMDSTFNLMKAREARNGWDPKGITLERQ